MPPFDLEAALRPALRGMRGYSPIAPPEEVAARYGIPVDQIVKLDANENPYGPSPKTLDAIRALSGAHRYPDPDQRAIRAALATTRGVHGATGEITLNERRDAVKNAVILRVAENGFRYHQTVEPQ